MSEYNWYASFRGQCGICFGLRQVKQTRPMPRLREKQRVPRWRSSMPCFNLSKKSIRTFHEKWDRHSKESIHKFPWCRLGCNKLNLSPRIVSLYRKLYSNDHHHMNQPENMVRIWVFYFISCDGQLTLGDATPYARTCKTVILSFFQDLCTTRPHVHPRDSFIFHRQQQPHLYHLPRYRGQPFIDACHSTPRFGGKNTWTWSIRTITVALLH